MAKNIQMEYYNGSSYEEIYPKVLLTNATGILPVANGGTGLNNSPSILVNLGSTSATSVLSSSPRPGVTGILGVQNGGTGVTSINDLITSIGSIRIQTGSYVGTGTHGKNNPCSLTFDFAPKILMFTERVRDGNVMEHINYSSSATENFNIHNLDALTTSYVEGAGFGHESSTKRPFGKKSEDGKTVYWYSEGGDSFQNNTSGSTYYWIAIG